MIHSFKPRVVIRSTSHIGKTVVPEMPANLLTFKGPYKARKQKRWRRENPPYTVSDGSFYLWRGFIICHENDVIRVAEMFRQHGFAVIA